MNASKVSLRSSIEGVSGPDNIAELWRKHYSDLFNCVRAESFSIGNVSP